MKLYVINLDRSQERLQNITSVFNNQGLKLERIPAVDAALICDEDCQKFAAINRWKYPLTKGEIACFLSHCVIWKKNVNDKLPYAAIFEDDADLSPDAHQFLSSCEWIPVNADIVKLETRKNRVHLGRAVKLNCSRRIAELKSTHLLSAGYIISQRAAARLLRESEKIIMPVDHFMFNFGYETARKLKLYQLDPAIVIQGNFPTTIMLPARKKKIGFQRKLSREMKRIIRDIRACFHAAVRFIAARESWKRVPWA